MAEQNFTHLHVHTDYSLLDGAITIKDLLSYGKEHNLKSLAISDHGNIFGGVKFFNACKKNGFHPVLGIEAYIADDAKVKNNNERYFHQLLLIKNKTGYQNVCRLLHYAFTQGFYFKPRIDYAALEQYSEGLIATTACLGGHIPQLLLQNQDQKAHDYIDKMLRIMGEDNFYIEVQPEEQEEQTIVNKKLFEISKTKGIPVIATADSHYSKAEDKEAHEIMLCIQTKHKITDPNRMSFGPLEVHLKTPQEMLDAFPDHPEAIWETGKVAQRCQFEYQMGKLFFPSYPIPQENETKPITEAEYFTRICFEGLESLIEQKRVPEELRENYQKRLQIEIDLITSMGFITYFLVVSDFIKWARRNNIPVGPGRGSAAGSLVAWTLEITNIDPIKYNLLFERFLNPERVTMPDIDIDFCIEGREKVINYVKDVYGHDNVCQIITFGTMLAKGVVKDVGRVLGIPFEETNNLTNLIPNQLKITLDQAFELEPQLVQLRDNNPKIGKLFTIAKKLEGLTRHASKHAAGLVISPQPVKDVLPLYVPPKTKDLVAQYAMTELEQLGYLKMDFLGLKNLTLIQRTLELIKSGHGVDIDIDHLPLDDQPTFALLSRGETSGVFQLESSGIKDVLRKLQPAVFEDIIAVNALYRPGPLGSGMVDDFIKRKHGEQKIQYLLPELEPVLKETYGVIVYQEQVMKIASTVGGYSLGEADILRRAMGKKKVEVMQEQRKLFVERATEKKFNTKKVGELFDLMAYFAGYGFNKSHSAAYALIAYQTAYLKTHYPAEFMACLISLEASDAEKMAFYIDEAKSMGLEILPPDINQSQIRFSTPEGKIRFGLHGIKSVGQTALDNIMEQQKEEPFKDLYDFCVRVELRTCNKRVIENLVYAGAFDSLPGNRAQKIAQLPQIMEQAQHERKQKETGQMGLFDVQKSDDDEYVYYQFAARNEYPDAEKLEREKEVLGVYMSAQPLDQYRSQIAWLKARAFTDILESKEQNQVIGCGLLKKHKVIMTKKGDKMAFAEFEDKNSSNAEVIIFPKLFEKVSDWLEEYNVFMIRGTLDQDAQRMCKLIANEIIPLDLICSQWCTPKKVTARLSQAIDESVLETIKNDLTPGKTIFEIIHQENNKTVKIISKQKFLFSLDCLQTLHKHKAKISINV